MKKAFVVINVSKASVLVGYKQHGQLVSNQRYVDDRLCKNACIRAYFSLCNSLFLCLFFVTIYIRFTSNSTLVYLSPPSECWDCRWALSHSLLCNAEDRIQDSGYDRQTLYQWRYNILNPNTNISLTTCTTDISQGLCHPKYQYRVWFFLWTSSVYTGWVQFFVRQHNCSGKMLQHPTCWD